MVGQNNDWTFSCRGNSGWKNSVLLGRAFHELPPLNNYLYTFFCFSSISSALTKDIFLLFVVMVFYRERPMNHTYEQLRDLDD